MCFQELRRESELYIVCAGCEEYFHYDCLDPEVLGAFFKATAEQSLWYCTDCAEDSESTREELKNFLSSVPKNCLQPPKKPKLEEAAQSLEDQDPSAETVDERDKNTEVDVEEEKNIEKEQSEAGQEKDSEDEVDEEIDIE